MGGREMGCLLGAGLLVSWVDFLHDDCLACVFDAGLGRFEVNPNAYVVSLLAKNTVRAWRECPP
jgi:hypothetical protein